MKKFHEDQEKQREAKIEEARKLGQLQECPCCYSDDCLEEDMLPCKNGHSYCSSCVQRASEVAIGEGKTTLTCLGQCEEAFELSALQRALPSEMFSKWLKKIQLAEVERADIEGLERCPFCEFATIMETTPEENKILSCENVECGKETCRLCKELSHIPLRCEEVEKDAEVRKRTYIENKMTEYGFRNAILRAAREISNGGLSLTALPCIVAAIDRLAKRSDEDYTWLRYTAVFKGLRTLLPKHDGCCELERAFGGLAIQL